MYGNSIYIHNIILYNLLYHLILYCQYLWQKILKKFVSFLFFVILYQKSGLVRPVFACLRFRSGSCFSLLTMFTMHNSHSEHMTTCPEDIFYRFKKLFVSKRFGSMYHEFSWAMVIRELTRRSS